MRGASELYTLLTMAGLRPEVSDLAGRYRRLLEGSFGARLIEVRVFGSQRAATRAPTRTSTCP